MSISSIMSGNEPEPSAYNSRRSSRASANHNAMKQEQLAALAPPHTPTPAHAFVAPGAAPLPNGDSHHVAAPSSVLPLPRPKPDEKDVEAELAKMEAADIGNLDAAGQELWREEYIQRSLKRTREIGINEAAKRKVRFPCSAVNLPFNSSSTTSRFEHHLSFSLRAISQSFWRSLNLHRWKFCDIVLDLGDLSLRCNFDRQTGERGP